MFRFTGSAKHLFRGQHLLFCGAWSQSGRAPWMRVRGIQEGGNSSCQCTTSSSSNNSGSLGKGVEIQKHINGSKKNENPGMQNLCLPATFPK